MSNATQRALVRARQESGERRGKLEPDRRAGERNRSNGKINALHNGRARRERREQEQERARYGPAGLRSLPEPRYWMIESGNATIFAEPEPGPFTVPVGQRDQWVDIQCRALEPGESGAWVAGTDLTVPDRYAPVTTAAHDVRRIGPGRDGAGTVYRLRPGQRANALLEQE